MAGDPIYTATGEEVDACTSWHGGMGSMFYAVSSTGSLSRGSIRPSVDLGDGWESMTDTAWSHDLASRLESEIRETITQADTAGESADVETFSRMLVKVAAIVNALEEEMAEDEECQIIVEVIGKPSGEQIGTCSVDGRPIYRSHFAGTIYHATEDGTQEENSEQD